MSNEIFRPQLPDFADLNRRTAQRQEELAGRRDAEGIFEYLRIKIEKFQSQLDENEEIGIQLANFGLAAQLHIRSIFFRNPNLIEFEGVDGDDNRVTLVQHISQLNFMLIAVKPVSDEPYRVGFNR